MDTAISVSGFWKDFGPTVRRYVKYQIYHNNYVSDFQDMRRRLQDRAVDVDTKLRTQLGQPGKIPRKEVETWLKDARQEIAVKVIDNLICKGGCFTYICSSRKLDKETQALEEGILRRGERYTNAGEILVMDDQSIQNCARLQKEVKQVKEKIEADLKTQLRQPGKIPWNKVEDWLKKASQQVTMKVEGLISQGECSSSTNIDGKIVEELKQTLEEGKEFTNVGVSLVIDDHSIQYCARVFEDKQKEVKQVKEKIEADLKTQLRQPGKIPWNKVEDWLKKASQQVTMKVEGLISQGECSSSTNIDGKIVEELKQTLEELKQTLEEGKEFTSVSLVIDDHSIQYCARVFEDKQKEVKQVKEKIEADLKTQLRQPGKIPWNKVEDWLKKASQQVTMKVEGLISQGECSSSTNIDGKIVEELKQTLEELKQTLEEGKEFTSVSLVIDDHSKKGVPMPAEKCIARGEVQEEILQLLRGDKVTRIAVCGMGGVGKTTIMKQVHNQLLKLKEPTIKKVIWVKVSRDFDIVLQQKKQYDILKFQKSIARKLGLELNEDEDATELAGRISQSLKQRGSCVLILDDVWEPFSLEHVGILDPNGNDACKMVLTTRSQEVAGKMQCKEIYVKPLPDDEALALFWDKVGSEVVSYPRYKSDIESFLNQILKKCNGLPLAIGVVAKTMRGKFDRNLWKIAAEELSKYEEIVDCLKFSYNHLDEQHQKCFLYCALYPEDHEIQKEELIEFWIEEGLIDERESRHLMICEGHSIIQKLIDNCMLESVKKEYNLSLVRPHEMVKIKNKEEDRVSMHDLLREMALKIIHPQFEVKAGMALEELPEEVEVEGRKNLLKVSLMKKQIREFPSSMLSPKCPMLTTLLLSINNITTIPEAFFDHMPRLKILDLSDNHKLHRLPSSVSKLQRLTTLLLENCKSLEEVPFLSNLGGLKKLNLYGTSIKELPQGLNMLTNLKYLWLGGMLSDIPNGLLRNLSKLQYLGVDLRIPLKWEEIGRLRKLESLDGRLSTLDDMSLSVKSERKFLNQYRIFVGSCSPNDKFFYNKNFSNVMKSIVCCHIDICEEPNWLPSDAQGFYILDCKDVRSLDDISGFQESTDLQHCTIDECDGLEFVVSSRCLKSLQNLQSLCLEHLKNLNEVVREVEAVAKSAPLPAGTFSSLQSIKVEFCGKIKKLLPVRLLRYLQNLQAIMVAHCDQMEEIIWSEYEEGERALEKLTLPKLERVILVNLLALKSIYSGSTTVLICDSLKRIDIQYCQEIESVFWTGFNPLPTLEHLKLWDLKNLKSVFDEKVLGLSAGLTNFFSLKTIDVLNCPKLKKVFSYGWLLGYFQSLETIIVRGCHQMEELISSSTYEEKEALEKVTLPNLQCVELNWLPELKSICSSSSVLICDSINNLLIWDCKKLKRIPLHLSSLDNGQPPSLKQIKVDTKERWESLEWDQSNAKDVLLPSVNFR
ncbi:hypothetical protein SLA2020_063120 [Shorea laevis]